MQAGSMRTTEKLLKGKALVQVSSKDVKHVSQWSKMSFPVSEMFYWKRPVFDEFHELESFGLIRQKCSVGKPPVLRMSHILRRCWIAMIDWPHRQHVGRPEDCPSSDGQRRVHPNQGHADHRA